MTTRRSLTVEHRTTLMHLEQHPVSHDLEWHDVLSLLREVGTVIEEHNGKVKVRLGGDALVIAPPRHKDIDEQTVLDLRRALREAGITAAEK